MDELFALYVNELNMVIWRLGLRLVSCRSDADESIHRRSSYDDRAALLEHYRPDEGARRGGSIERSQQI